MLAYAEACNAEIRDLFAAGADIVQLDEPYMQARPEGARTYGLTALPYVEASRLALTPDCGMRYLPREVANGKLRAMTAAAILRREFGG